jgi:hypothetical protein
MTIRADTQVRPYDGNAVEEAFPGKKVGISPTLLGAFPMDIVVSPGHGGENSEQKQASICETRPQRK